MLLITFWPLIYQFWMSFTNFSNRNLRTDNLILQMIGTFTGNLKAHNSPAWVGLQNYISILNGDLGNGAVRLRLLAHPALQLPVDPRQRLLPRQRSASAWRCC